MAEAPPPKAHVLGVTMRNKASLYAAYIPWMKAGGLFVPTSQSMRLGEPVLLLFTLLDEPARIPVSGRVAWVTPANAHGNRPQGVGVQFDDVQPLHELRKKIEGMLAGTLQSSRPTHTL